MIEYNKLEVFHFSKATKNHDPPFLDLGLLKGSFLQSKNSWQYLRFIFNRKLSFCQHVYHYFNKALSTIKDMKILGNSTRGLLSSHK